MGQPYVGEIRMFAGNFPPNGWFFCEGQLLPISEFDVLYQLIGTTYGGDGENTYALPDLRGRLPIHQGNGYILAETGGAEDITLSVSQIPAHSHPLLASTNPGTQGSAARNLLSASPSITPYLEDVATVNMSAQAITPVGGSQPHSNLQPSLCVSFIISVWGIFPSQY